MDNMDKLIEILKKIKPNVDFSKEINLIESGVLTSFDIIRLIVEINNEYDVEITPLHTTPENFQSVDTIYNLIEKLADED